MHYVPNPIFYGLKQGLIVYHRLRYEILAIPCHVTLFVGLR
jgi:hypothetical protein